MFKCLFHVTLLTYIFHLSGCENSTSNPDYDTDESEYYVKYEINSSTIYHGGTLEVSISDEKNEKMDLIIDQRQPWEIVIGPVQKGFKSSLFAKATGNTHNRLTLQAAIYVSKNDSPFAIKKLDGSDVPRDSVYIFYTIDY